MELNDFGNRKKKLIQYIKKFLNIFQYLVFFRAHRNPIKTIVVQTILAAGCTSSAGCTFKIKKNNLL